jgi:hypothetical protein
MKNEFFNGDKIHDGLSSRQYRSGRKERAPDREECQYANCAIAETRWTRTSPIGENRKGKGKIQRKEKKWRVREGKDYGGGEQVIYQPTRLGLRLIPWILFAGHSARGQLFSFIEGQFHIDLGILD